MLCAISSRWWAISIGVLRIEHEEHCLHHCMTQPIAVPVKLQAEATLAVVLMMLPDQETRTSVSHTSFQNGGQIGYVFLWSTHYANSIRQVYSFINVSWKNWAKTLYYLVKSVLCGNCERDKKRCVCPKILGFLTSGCHYSDVKPIPRFLDVKAALPWSLCCG